MNFVSWGPVNQDSLVTVVVNSEVGPPAFGAAGKAVCPESVFFFTSESVCQSNWYWRMLMDPHRVVPVNHSGVMTCEHELGCVFTSLQA